MKSHEGKCPRRRTAEKDVAKIPKFVYPSKRNIAFFVKPCDSHEQQGRK